jgi:Pyoverdine/dityrosine biosynthesis protein
MTEFMSPVTGSGAADERRATDAELPDSPFRLISRGHRAIELARRPEARLYSQAEFHSVARGVSPAFWADTFLPLLRRSASEKIASRLTAALKRARKNAQGYGVGRPGPREAATEVLFDSQLVKLREQFTSRAAVHRHLGTLRESRTPLRLALPLFSRKPVSPVKNRGPYPDLAEIASLLRCYELAAMLSWVYDEKSEFLVFADGMKYRRACGTGVDRIRRYQDALRYWSAQLGIDDLVKVVDYEDAVSGALGADGTRRREAAFEERSAELHARLDGHFDPRDPAGCLDAISRLSPEGEQLGFTFRSIASSVCYRTEGLGDRLARHTDESARLYLGYLGNLLVDLRAHPAAARSGTRPQSDDVALHLALRTEAWQAAVRYVAISLVDRGLDMWARVNPAGLKMTTHGKAGEIQIRPTRSKYMSITAQHCVGGVVRTQGGSKVTYSYRLENESSGQVPVLFDQPPAHGTRSLDGPVLAMLEARQPVCYVDPDDGAPWETLSDSVVDF